MFVRRGHSSASNHWIISRSI